MAGNSKVGYIVGIAITIVLIAIVVYYMTNKKESFAGLGHSFTVKVDQEYKDSQGNFHSIPSTYKTGDFYIARPGFQSVLSPRFSNVTYGPYLNERMPLDNGILGVPKTPLTIDNVINPQIAGQDKFVPGGGITNDMLPNMSPDAIASVQQPVMYDRYIYANQKSRLRESGDPIRGDLPIVPGNLGWFTPSVTPNIDLRDGAMAVLGGEDNSTARSTLALVQAASGGTTGAYAGVPVMAAQKVVGFSALGSDVHVKQV